MAVQKRRRILSFDRLDGRVLLDSSPIPAPVGVTQPIEPPPSQAGLFEIQNQASSYHLNDNAGAFPVHNDPPPVNAAPSGPVILGSYGGPVVLSVPGNGSVPTLAQPFQAVSYL